ncbi:efflux RND transporter permease subunit [Alkalispirochaeta alkalica]|uniref:efflux RND transporter permease subunit n=1 Tax=Alkalispirochaeta alkalica TaxID=46356 RepID=UPI00037DC049|nr:efflux RND transporter permease subunit [Alkalispirochaeta alkalica]
MFLSDLSIRRPVLMTMVLAATLLFGAIGFIGLPLNMMPAVDIPYVTIQTVYPGANPDQVASQVSQLIEDEVSTVSGLKKMLSYSLDSVSIIILEFDIGKDPDIATQETKDKVDTILNDLPDDAERPIIQKLNITETPVVNLVASGDLEAVTIGELAETTLRDHLSRIPGVSQVNISGNRKREIRVELSNHALYENALSLPGLARTIAGANLDMPGGAIQTGGQDFSVRLDGRFLSLEDLSNLEIPVRGERKILGNIARIIDTGEEMRERTSFLDNLTGEHFSNTVTLEVMKTPEGNPVEIAQNVRALLPALRELLPAGVDLAITSDSAEAIQGSVDDTLSNILLGILLTALVLLLFLHDLRSTLIIALSMPMSIIPTFFVMDLLGMSLNIMSLMGIATAVGVLIMNSVVVLENIFRHKELGHDRRTAAARGTAEVTVAVVASTMTNIAVFFPMATMSGIAGLFLREFALAISFATLFSLLISFTLTPMLASLLLPEVDRKKHPLGDRLEAFFRLMEGGYAFILEKTLHSKLRSALLIVGTILIFLLAMSFFGKVPFEFSPAMDQGTVRIDVELPTGSDLDRTAALLREVERRVARYREVENAVITLGSTSALNRGTNLARVDIKLIERSDRVSNEIIAAQIGEDLADLPGAIFRVSSSQSESGMAPVTFYLQGLEREVLEELAATLRPKLDDIPGLRNIDSSNKPGSPEVVLYPDRQKLVHAGITVQDLALTVRGAVEGLVMSTFREGGEEYDIRVALAKEDVSGADRIGQILIPTEAGIFPLEHFARVELSQAGDTILREDKILSVEFSADLDPGYVLGHVNQPIQDLVNSLDLPPGYGLSWGGDAEMLEETVREFLFVFILAIVLTYMLLAAILEKFVQPLLILSTIPLSLIGVVVAFLLTGKTMNIVSMLAIVMLVGLVVNNAILILDYANQLRREGRGVRQALLEAAPAKLRPIVMANSATILGMLPMALGIGAWGAEMRQPMGIVSIGGLATTTFLSLFVIPAFENLIESRKDTAGTNPKKGRNHHD